MRSGPLTNTSALRNHSNPLGLSDLMSMKSVSFHELRRKVSIKISPLIDNNFSMFKHISTITGASCSGIDLCCDPSTCSVRTQGFICREETGDCDVAEICNGTSPECPHDHVKRPGFQCEIHGLPGHCLYGYCSSHYSQCKWFVFDPLYHFFV